MRIYSSIQCNAQLGTFRQWPFQPTRTSLGRGRKVRGKVCSSSHLQVGRKSTSKSTSFFLLLRIPLFTLRPIFVPIHSPPPPPKRTLNYTTCFSTLTWRRWASAREKISSHPNRTFVTRFITATNNPHGCLDPLSFHQHFLSPRPIQKTGEIRREERSEDRSLRDHSILFFIPSDPRSRPPPPPAMAEGQLSSIPSHILE